MPAASIPIPSQRVLRQRNWSEAELRAAGFRYYLPVRRLVMARVTEEAAEVATTLEILLADEGDVICYEPGDEPHDDLDEYDHWPVQRELFIHNYRRWETTGWAPSPAERRLLELGCRPFYKSEGIWALRLPIAIYVQSLESPEPVIVPAGRWLCIGSGGEPYHMSDEKFRTRYFSAPEE